MAEQGSASGDWNVVNRDFVWSIIPVPGRPDPLPEDVRPELFDFAFTRILLVSYKTDTDVGARLNDDLFAVIRSEIPAFAIPDGYRGIGIRTNAEVSMNPVRHFRVVLANDDVKTVTVVDYKDDAG